MKKLLGLVLGLMILMSACNMEKSDQKVVDLGISQIVEYEALDESRTGFLQALKEGGYEDGKNLKVDYQNAQGDISLAQSIGKKFASDKKDMIFAISTPSAQGAFNATKDIPIMITAVTDPTKSGLSDGAKNISGTSDYLDIKNQINLIKNLIPDAKTIGIIYNTGEINSELQVKELESKASGYKIEKVGVTSINEIPAAISSLTSKVDVIYAPTDQMIVSSLPVIVEKSKKYKIPVIAAEKGSVKNGALATTGIDYEKLGYETGKMAVEVLKGKDISKLPIKTSSSTKIYINKDTAKYLGIKINLKDVEYVD